LLEPLNKVNHGMINLDICLAAGVRLANDRWVFLEDHDIQDQDPSTDEVMSKSKKKREKKKRSEKTRLSKAVSFGTVEEILFKRQVGGDRVPSKGLFPLGLGELDCRGIIHSVDEYCSRQQQELQLRLSSISSSLESSEPSPTSVACSSPSATSLKKKLSDACKRIVTSSDTASPSEVTLETRQFDFKMHSFNPLFQSVTEEERLVLLGPHIGVQPAPVAATATKGSTNADAHQNDHHQSSSQNQNHMNHSSSGSHHHHHDSHNHGQPHHHSHHHPHQHIVSEINKEVKDIRLSRENAGCSCKSLKLDKLSNGKIKSELISRGNLIGICKKEEVEAMSKTDLTNAMRELIKVCELCTENNCECVQLGIPCSADVCGCMKHGRKCANPEGRIVYDQKKVIEYRKKILEETVQSQSQSEKTSEKSATAVVAE
jgi:hypothetical protein